MSKLSLSRAWEETMAVLARDGRLFAAVALALFVLPGLIVNREHAGGPDGRNCRRAGAWVAVAVSPC